MLQPRVACGAPSSYSCSVLHLNLIKADGESFNFHFNLPLDKISPFRGTFCFFKSLFSAEKLNLWGTSSQWCKLEEMPVESRGKLPFVYLATHHKNGQVSHLPACFIIMLMSNIYVFCLIFLQAQWFSIVPNPDFGLAKGVKNFMFLFVCLFVFVCDFRSFIPLLPLFMRFPRNFLRCNISWSVWWSHSFVHL